MSVEDALPERPLFEAELTALDADLPDRYQVLPLAAMDFDADELLYPVFSVETPDSSVALYGWSSVEKAWISIHTWSADEFDPDEQADTIEAFAEEHLPQGSIASRVDLAE